MHRVIFQQKILLSHEPLTVYWYNTIPGPSLKGICQFEFFLAAKAQSVTKAIIQCFCPSSCSRIAGHQPSIFSTLPAQYLATCLHYLEQ